MSAPRLETTRPRRAGLTGWKVGAAAAAVLSVAVTGLAAGAVLGAVLVVVAVAAAVGLALYLIVRVGLTRRRRAQLRPRSPAPTR